MAKLVFNNSEEITLKRLGRLRKMGKETGCLRVFKSQPAYLCACLPAFLPS
jgi:hypothetical protein